MNIGGLFFILMSSCGPSTLDEDLWYLEAPDGLLVSLPPEPGVRWHLQQRTERGWLSLGRVQRGHDPNPVPWFVPLEDLDGSAIELRWRAGGRGPFIVNEAAASLLVERNPAELFDAGDELGLRVKLVSDALRSGQLHVQLESRSSTGAETGWLARSCRDGDSLADCFGEADELWSETTAERWHTLPRWERFHMFPTTEQLRVDVRVPANSANGRQMVVAATASTRFLSSGRHLVWGDPHAQSNLSWDGCEVDDEGCISRFGTPAADFFQQARLAGLDFAGLTDSSEAASYFPNGVLAREYPIWDEQTAAVNSSVREDFVPLLGFEWSPHDLVRSQSEAPWDSGARVVLFEASDVCLDYRVAAQRAQTSLEKGQGSYSPAEGPVSSTATGLYEAFERGAAICGYEPLVAFAAHPTHEPHVDWESSENQGDSRWETLFEIYSERGRFECVDPEEQNCVAEGEYIPAGSFQAALMAGRRLGVLAATDAHDGRPGSVSDGPSTRWLFGETSSTASQEQGGGLTGVWVAEPLSAHGLVDGMQRRYTVASTGPMLSVRALGLGVDGVPYLPGSVVPAEAWPLSIKLVFDDGWAQDVAVHWIAADGEIVGTHTDLADWMTLADPGEEAVYGRVDLGEGGDLLWVSPFFREQP